MCMCVTEKTVRFGGGKGGGIIESAGEGENAGFGWEKEGVLKNKDAFIQVIIIYYLLFLIL